jgi:nicotinate phosphoribosyltransferase
MSDLTRTYKTSVALFTDLYQLTMAQAAWSSGISNKRTVFHLFFRKSPFRGGYAVAAGLEPALEYLEAFHFTEDDLDYLRSLTAEDGSALFQPEFLRSLQSVRAEVQVDAVAEGLPVFANEPLLRVTGAAISCMLVESPLLNFINFQTLIATKAARILEATRGEPVLEFGLRRAQGIDGALSATRAAYIGGCAATSNALAGKLYGIPVRGTHAHSWVMLFDDELEAFRTYATALPNNCVFLVDTYDTLQGVAHAIEVGRTLRTRGHRLLGVRLDSGDLSHLSGEARRMLDEAGFQDTHIFATNELDENVIQSLQLQGARIDVWGVGTRLITGFDEPALGGVYKLGAVDDGRGGWTYRLKVSEQAVKTSIPGVLQVRRFTGPNGHQADMIYDLTLGPGQAVLVDPVDATRRRRMDPSLSTEDLLQPVFRDGARLHAAEPLEVIRRRARVELSRLQPGVRRFANPQEYRVGLEQRLHEMRTQLILRERGMSS